MLFIRGRKRASLSLLTASCLGFALLAVTPTTTSATAQTTQPAARAKLAPKATDYAPADCHKPGAGKNVAQCFTLVYTGDSGHRARANGPAPTSLGPQDIKAAYNLPAGGQGQTVAIVDAYGDSHAEEDLAVFRSHYGLPACTTANGCFRKTDQDGGTSYPADDAGWAMETALDLDAVSSACPACNILLVQASTPTLDNLSSAVDTAVALGAKFVSNSYGLPGESSDQTSYDKHYDHPGVVITVSTGDEGNVQSWPATNPHVTAVGGTRLVRDTSAARGWGETAWEAGGSGCSRFEPQPNFQAALTTGCDRRATADISAVADPATGLGIYNTLGNDGWTQVGGTSLSAPLVAAMYALAGTPAEDTYPVSYPFTGHHGLFDITEGSDGGCGTLLCNAGDGWDGPTGMGSPNGVTALTIGSHGKISGRVTDQGTHKGIAGAQVSLADTTHDHTFHTTTDSDGRYRLTVSTGTYETTAVDFAYETSLRSGVTVGKDQSVTADFTLKKAPVSTVSGKVTDASGHGWPLYTKITIDGYPHGAVYTDPITGVYSVDLPENRTYSLHAAPVYPGYESTDLQVALGTRDRLLNLKPKIDQTLCQAPGYSYPLREDFESFTSRQPQNKWKVTDNNGSTDGWNFDDPQNWNITGGDGKDASAVPMLHGGTMDSSLLSPPIQLAAGQQPQVAFNSAYAPDSEPGTVATVDVTFDNGRTWSTLWSGTKMDLGTRKNISLPDRALHSTMQLRLHFKGSGDSLWEVDNFTVGQCAPVAGGLITGNVSDGNTGGPVNDAHVEVSRAIPTVSGPTPDDTRLSDGFYWLFSSPGRHTLTTSANRYTTTTSKTTIIADRAVRRDTILQAGRIVVSRENINLAASLGRTATQTLRLRNTGRSAAHVTLGEQSFGYTLPDGRSSASLPGAPRKQVPLRSASGTPLRQMPTDLVPKLLPPGKRPATKTAATNPPQQSSSVSPWTTLAGFPEQVMENVAGYHAGKLYSVAGIDNVLSGTASSHGYVYDPGTSSWARIADMPQASVNPAGDFVGDTMYVVGGWRANADGVVDATSTVYAYHPNSNTWTRAADLPVPVAVAQSAVLDGRLYVIGGCRSGCDTHSAEVYRYDPAANAWSRLADYPTPLHSASCAGVSGAVVCAGGSNFETYSKATYRYDVPSDTWTRAADLPRLVWSGAAGGADGKLQVIGGIEDFPDVNGFPVPLQVTNQVLQYDPVTNAWNSLPNAPEAAYDGGGACGLYEVGGSTSAGFTLPSGSTTAQALPGYDQCGTDDVSWLSANRSTFELAPGQSVTITVRADGSTIGQAGTYSARLITNSTTPYANTPVKVDFSVTPPHHGGTHPHSSTHRGKTVVN
ncbi:kelch repeat-containing protein [Streptomyces sp. NPDC059215]|uniref:kelch repeat-containing protein n=1 Tax=Streptomyces sp. NPDC059215 TaxID=3346772 RepID=UPI00369367ED